MLRRKQFFFDRREPTSPSAEKNSLEQPQLVTIVSRPTKGDLHSAENHRADITRQALSIMPATLENERRSNYLAAGMIVTILGGWLGSSALKSRWFTTLTFILLFFLGAALAGIFLGAVLGQGFISVEPLQVALFAIAGISVFVLGVALTLMLWSRRANAEPSFDQTPLPEILIPIEEVNPRGVLIPVKELNPYQHEGRRKTD